ncbi:hypothetical protein A176_001649 [Myxococcus hansupus]|uniref:Uncharacterized protein n=1 Tax=Pseudomyxococcus hansupus TaxID=1297742 RepID=A0A0H4XA18_9BACT|nr:hypothetical protein A176_001649 [Myxococcus hansupus]
MLCWLLVESLVWAAVAFLSFKVGAVFQRRWGRRVDHLG